MKITTRQLRQLIKEEIGNMNSNVATIDYYSSTVPGTVTVNGRSTNLGGGLSKRYFDAYKIMTSGGATMVQDDRISETPVPIDEWVAITEGEFS